MKMKGLVRWCPCCLCSTCVISAVLGCCPWAKAGVFLAWSTVGLQEPQHLLHSHSTDQLLSCCWSSNSSGNYIAPWKSSVWEVFLYFQLSVAWCSSWKPKGSAAPWAKKQPVCQDPVVSTHGFTGSAGEVIIVIMIDANPNTIFPGHKEYRWHPLGVLSSVKAGRQGWEDSTQHLLLRTNVRFPHLAAVCSLLLVGNKAQLMSANPHGLVKN